MRLMLCAAAVALMASLAACGSSSAPEATPTQSSGGIGDILAKLNSAPASPSPSTTLQPDHKPQRVVDHSCIRYEVTGSARGANVTYATLTGASQASVAVPMTTTDGHPGARLCGFGSGDSLYISAQNQGESGDITCEIRVSGIGVVSRNTSQGAYSIATCQSMLP